MARPQKPYDQLAFQRPNSRHKGRAEVQAALNAAFQRALQQPRCSFCGIYPSEEIRVLAAVLPYRGYICEECVQQAVEVLEDLRNSSSQGGSLQGLYEE